MRLTPGDLDGSAVGSSLELFSGNVDRVADSLGRWASRVPGEFLLLVLAMELLAPQLAWLPPVEAGRVTWKHAESLLWRVAWMLAALALADYGLQRYRWMAGLKMSRQEVRDEAKQNETNPEIKSRVRRIQRELHALQEAEVLRDALESQPDDPDVQARAGRAWLANGQVKQGLELLERLLQKHPRHAAAHEALAEYYESIGEKGLAAKHRRAANPPPT